MRQQPNILYPDHWHREVLAHAAMPNIRLLHGSLIPTKKLFLHLPEGSTRFDEINRLDARCKALEVAKCLFVFSRQFSDPTLFFPHNPPARNNSGPLRATQFKLTLNISSINVPFPGPTSINCTPSDRFPCAIHSATVHMPINSPNTCDISGDVTKSPPFPNTASRVV